MKGSIFIALSELVENEHGIRAWEEILEEVNPECQGIYTSIEDYPDEDITSYVAAISQKLNMPASDITRHFGAHLFSELNAKHPIFTKLTPDLFKFIESIETVIHKEVRKLFDQPNLPTIQTQSNGEHKLKMIYYSPRKLCYLAEGLIYGAADHYGETITLSHETCMHSGDKHCVIEIERQRDG